MNKDQIKAEFIREVENLFYPEGMEPPAEFNEIGHLRDVNDKVQRFSRVLIGILNSILKRNNVSFPEERSRHVFLAFIHPVISDLINLYRNDL